MSMLVRAFWLAFVERTLSLVVDILFNKAHVDINNKLWQWRTMYENVKIK